MKQDKNETNKYVLFKNTRVGLVKLNDNFNTCARYLNNYDYSLTRSDRDHLSLPVDRIYSIDFNPEKSRRSVQVMFYGWFFFALFPFISFSTSVSTRLAARGWTSMASHHNCRKWRSSDFALGWTNSKIVFSISKCALKCSETRQQENYSRAPA